MISMCSRELDPLEITAIRRIKAWVNRLTEVRKERERSASVVEPSVYWRFFSQAFDYMKAMPPEQFKTMRLHTYHLDGDTYQISFFGDEDNYHRYYTGLHHELPERYKIGAPELCGEYGYLVNGRLVNDKVLKWQEIIRALWFKGQFTALENSPRPLILEIGGGYGSLAHHFNTMFPNSLYFIVDIPETLLFAASYLTLIHGQESVLLLDEDTEVSVESLKNLSFVMVPNSLLKSISSLRFGLSINVASFQEMTEPQVTQYLEFLSSRTDVLLSANIDRFQATTDKVFVADLLRRYFELTDLPPVKVSPAKRRDIRRMLRSSARSIRDGLITLLYWPTSRPAKRQQGGGRFLAVPKGINAVTSSAALSSAGVSD
jgi:putative sugar O-methyltransferase